MKVPEARAVVVWMVGEEGLSSKRISQMLPVVLRYLAGSFMKEADETKLQILNCSAKVLPRHCCMSSIVIGAVKSCIKE
jgi:AP-3 complex subunit beta